MMYAVRGWRSNPGWVFTGLQRARTEKEARSIAKRESAKKGQRSRVYAVERYDWDTDEWTRLAAYVNGAVVSDGRAMVGDMDAMKKADAQKRDLEEAKRARAEHYAHKDKRIIALVAEGIPMKQIKKTLRTSDHYIAKVLARAKGTA